MRLSITLPSHQNSLSKLLGPQKACLLPSGSASACLAARGELSAVSKALGMCSHPALFFWQEVDFAASGYSNAWFYFHCDRLF